MKLIDANKLTFTGQTFADENKDVYIRLADVKTAIAQSEDVSCKILSSCYREFCDVVGASTVGCDACPYKNSETCLEDYINDKMRYLESENLMVFN